MGNQLDAVLNVDREHATHDGTRKSGRSQPRDRSTFAPTPNPKEATMHTDRYTKTVLTVIAAALTAIALSPWATAGGWIDALRPQGAEAQDCPTTSGDLSV